MRCPQCSKRNSVAALACGDCGYRFKKKPVPFQAKFFIGFVAALVLLWGVASALVPRLVDSHVSLARAAKSLANGPKSQADATRLSSDFDRALQDVLKQSGNAKDADLIKKLAADLPSSFFEIHIFPLARNIKLVEVDNVLHVSDYLVWNKTNETAVLPVSGLDVYDDGTTVNDVAGKFLVLIGHTAAQSSHHPNVKVFALSPTEITDQTDKLAPKLPGEGTIGLNRNKQDIVANLSLFSVGQAENVFSASQNQPVAVEDETVPYSLQWQSGHYVLRPNCGKGQLAALYCLAKCLKDPSFLNRYQTLLGGKAKKQFQSLDRSKLQEMNFVVTPANKDGNPGKNAAIALFKLTNANVVAKVELDKRSGGNRTWGVSGIEIAPVDKGASQVQQAAKEETKDDETIAANSASATKEAEAALSSLKEKDQDKNKPEGGNTVEKPPEGTTPPETATNDQASENSNQSNSDQAEKTSDTTTSETTQSSSENTVAAIRGTTNSIILRKGPGTNFGALDEIAKGTPIQVLGEDKSWYKVRVNGKEGYVYAGLLEYKQPDAYTVATIKQGKRVTDESNRQLASLQVGDRLVVLGGIKNNKYKVQLANGKVGYVDKEALDVSIDAPPLVP